MSRARSNSVKVTFVIPRDLIELADLQAEKMGLERYDVIRMAIAQGLLVLRMQTELVTDFDSYRDDLLALVTGNSSAAQSIADKMEPRLVDGVKKQVAARGSGAA